MSFLKRRKLLREMKALMARFPEPPPEAYVKTPEKVEYALLLRERVVDLINALERGEDGKREVEHVRALQRNRPWPTP